MASERVRRLDWRTAGFAAAATGLNVGVIALLSLAALGVNRPGTGRAAPTVYLDIEPRPTLRDERPRKSVAGEAMPARANTTPSTRRRFENDDQDATPTPAVIMAPSGAIPAEPDAVAPGLSPAQRAAIARSLRQGAAGCGALPGLTAEERRACQDRRARLAEGAAPIAGSGDAGRDAAFARQGARRLQAWETQRAEPPRGDPPCESPHPVAGCEGVNVQVEIFSSRDGLLPNLRKRRE